MSLDSSPARVLGTVGLLLARSSAIIVLLAGWELFARSGRVTMFVLPPLSRVTNFAAGVATEGEFSGKGLGTSWSVPQSRSAYMGTFTFE